MGKMTLSANEISEKWARRTKAAISDAVAGVNRVTENPATKAIAKKDKMLAGITAAVQSGRWANGLSKVSLEEWKTKTASKIQERTSGGIDAAAPKRQAFDNYLVATVTAGQAKVNQMADMTLEDGIARSAAMQRHMAANPYKGKK